MAKTKKVLCVLKNLAELADWGAAFASHSYLIFAATTEDNALEVLLSRRIDAVVLSLPLEQEVYLAEEISRLIPCLPVVFYNLGQETGDATVGNAVARTKQELSDIVHSLLNPQDGTGDDEAERPLH